VVTAGGIDRSKPTLEEQVIQADTVIVHNKYDAAKKTNDIALLKLPQRFLLGENKNILKSWAGKLIKNFKDGLVNVVRLPKKSDARKSFAGIPVVLSGYGIVTESKYHFHF
jgi:hypothetical protein